MQTLLKVANEQSEGIDVPGLKPDVNLQTHQQEAIRHQEGKPGAIFAHGTGSGKTLSAISAAQKHGGNTLAVTPASLTENYQKEVEKFLEPEEHEKHRAVSYAKFRKDPLRHIQEHRPKTLIMDEAHRARNPTQTRTALREARPHVDRAIATTASPVVNEPTDIVPLVNLVAGQKQISQEELKRRYLKDKQEKPGLWGRIRGVQPGEKTTVQNKDELRERLSPLVHMYEPEPDEHWPDVDVEDVEVPMSDRQQSLIKQIEKENPALSYKMRRNLPPSKKEVQNLNAFMQATRQISNTPVNYDVREDDPIESSPKYKKMLEDVERAAEEDDNFRGVTYSNYLGSGVTPLVERLRERGVEGGLYEGSLTDKQREELLERFEKGEDKVLGMSPAGGEGLDLKGVKQIQVTEPDWNPETTRQAVGRAIRYKSHEHLPEDERNVQVRKYKSTFPEKWYHKLPGVDRPTSPDQYLESLQKQKARLNREFLDAVRGEGADERAKPDPVLG